MYGHTNEKNMYICLCVHDIFAFTKINSGPCYVLALGILSEAIKFLNNFVLFDILQKKLKASLAFFFRIKKERHAVTYN